MNENSFVNEIDIHYLRKIRKKEIKRNAAQIGVATIMLFAVMFFWYVPVVYIMALFGVNNISILTDPFVSEIVQIVAALLYVIPFFILLKCKRKKIQDVMSFSKPKNKLTIPYLLSGLGIALIFSVASNYFCIFLILLGINVPQISIEPLTGVMGVTVTFIASVIMPALLEEFAMRGVVLGVLRRFGDKVAIFCSALMFGIMHASIFQIPFTFLFGLFLGIVVVKTESLWPAILLHAINNANATISGYMSLYFGDTVGYYYSQTVFILAFILGIIGIVLMIKRGGLNLKNVNDDTDVMSTKERIKAFVLSPIIIFCILFSLFGGFILR